MDFAISAVLTDFGIYRREAQKIVGGLASVEDLERLHDWVDYWSELDEDKRTAPLLHHFLTSKEPLPSTFETRAQRKEREAIEADRRRRQQPLLLAALP